MKTRIAIVRTLTAVLFIGLAACDDGDAGENGGISMGYTLGEEVTAADVGLPQYPGSEVYKDHDDDPGAARVRISTSSFGLKVAAVKFETSDDPDEVARFYRQALAKYGEVLDCSDRDNQHRTNKDGLECEDGDVRNHKVVYKVGTDSNQRVVAIKPRRGGTQFSLVRVIVRE